MLSVTKLEKCPYRSSENIVKNEFAKTGESLKFGHKSLIMSF